MLHSGSVNFDEHHVLIVDEEVHTKQSQYASNTETSRFIKLQLSNYFLRILFEFLLKHLKLYMMSH